MFENARIDNIFTDFYFEQFTASLNEVLTDYPVRLNAQGTLLTLMCKSRTPNLGAAVIVWRPKAIFTSKHKISDVVFSLLFFIIGMYIYSDIWSGVDFSPKVRSMTQSILVPCTSGCHSPHSDMQSSSVIPRTLREMVKL